MLWAYGITTIPERRNDLFPRTMRSLKSAGFSSPRIFIDGAYHEHENEYRTAFCCNVTMRYPRVLVSAHWLLSMWELYLREPKADRYVLFQDDIICYRNLREYLEVIPYPSPASPIPFPNGYCNLFTSPCNESGIKPSSIHPINWYPSRTLRNKTGQGGKGAQALMFDNASLQALLSSPHMVRRFQNPTKSWKNIDGGIVQAMNDLGYREYIHFPSLVQHTGEESSTIAEGKRLVSSTFRGEIFNALSLLKTN
jgi:hypothetical protein